MMMATDMKTFFSFPGNSFAILCSFYLSEIFTPKMYDS